MAGSATRYTGGIATELYRSAIGSLPDVPTPTQYTFSNVDFVPYLATQWTTTQTNGTAAAFAWNSGVVKLSTTGGSATDAIYLTGLMQGNQIRANNRNWFSVDIAIPSTSATDITFRAGLTDTVNPASAANGILFVKAAGGTSVDLQVIKGGTTTTFQKVADLARPSGLFGDTTSSVGTMTANPAGTTLTALTIATPGAGYAKDPLVVINGTAGSGATGRVELGSASLYNAVVTSAGSGYTAGTFTAEIDHFVQLCFSYDARGTLYVGVGQNRVMSVGRQGSVSVAAGGTVDTSVAGTDSYVVSTQIASGMTFVPVAGDFLNMAPLVTLYPAVGYVGTTANARAMYIDQMNYAGEY